MEIKIIIDDSKVEEISNDLQVLNNWSGLTTEGVQTRITEQLQDILKGWIFAGRTLKEKNQADEIKKADIANSIL